jgi:co-chaperonin GroES (HSP10)
MSKKLYLPEHVLDRINKTKAAKEAEPASVSTAYVSAEDRVLDPGLIENPLVDRLPQPTGWRILVMPYKGKTKTDGGLILPDQVREREALATVVAYVMRLGPLAYKDPNKFGDNAEPWCQEGQWVCIGRYAGSRFKIEGGEVRIINDDEVIATILEPDDIQHV